MLTVVHSVRIVNRQNKIVIAAIATHHQTAIANRHSSSFAAIAVSMSAEIAFNQVILYLINQNLVLSKRQYV
jgi:hypothetical protein